MRGLTCSAFSRLDPKVAQAYANRGGAYTLLGMNAEDRQDMERAVELGFWCCQTERGDRGTKEAAPTKEALTAYRSPDLSSSMAAVGGYKVCDATCEKGYGGYPA